MVVERIRLRDFRSYERAEVALGPGLTVVWGRNGTGKTNLLEALYFGCTGRSCRTGNEREVVRFGAPAARVELDARDEQGPHTLSVGFAPGHPKRMRADGLAVERLLDVTARPLVSVFLPARLELVKGPPALRRAHADQLVAALWPSRANARRAYGQALAQRNALIARIRSGVASQAALRAWDAELARHGVALMGDRARAVAEIAGGFGERARELGLQDGARIRYRPRSRASEAAELAAELAARLDADLERGFTGHGPHRDDVVLELGSDPARELRVFGSQGQQRLALLALLVAEREAVARARGAVPLMLLDDVMSELDVERRRRLVQLLREGGQSVITATELAHVPAAGEPEVHRLAVSAGAVHEEGARDEARAGGGEAVAA